MEGTGSSYDVENKDREVPELRGALIGLLVGILVVAFCIVADRVAGRRGAPCFFPGCPPSCMRPQVGNWPDCHDPPVAPKVPGAVILPKRIL